MSKQKENLNIMIDDISDEGVDFNNLEEIQAEDDDNISIEEPKTQESLSSVNSDDSVKIYLQQIGKIPLLSSEEEFFAECFAEYMTSNKPRGAAKIFGEIIDKALGR